MCSLFGLIDFKGVLNTHTKNKILHTLKCAALMQPALPTTLMTACGFISARFPLER